ncbi:MAG: glycerol-3-phosphate 1-O-acyltransferase PlsY, partial [Clostridiales bacterium]|nr:glycerol-3-phosphate 1-O-acyltransferase PlsY [Clostridiales bacterium]
FNFGVILSRKIARDDVRNHGSGNAGATNMLRNYGKKLAFITIFGDMLKVAAAIALTFIIIKNSFADYNLKNQTVYELINSYFGAGTDIMIKSFSGFFCVLGHIFPCFFKFKGGKGVATSGGMVFIIDWRIALILLAVFIIIVGLTKYVSLGSIVMAILYPVLIFAFHKSFIITIIAVVFTVIVLIAHRVNIKKLINGSESKISFSHSKKS